MGGTSGASWTHRLPSVLHVLDISDVPNPHFKQNTELKKTSGMAAQVLPGHSAPWVRSAYLRVCFGVGWCATDGGDNRLYLLYLAKGLLDVRDRHCIAAHQDRIHAFDLWSAETSSCGCRVSGEPKIMPSASLVAQQHSCQDIIVDLLGVQH